MEQYTYDSFISELRKAIKEREQSAIREGEHILEAALTLQANLAGFTYSLECIAEHAEEHQLPPDLKPLVAFNEQAFDEAQLANDFCVTEREL